MKNKYYNFEIFFLLLMLPILVSVTYLAIRIPAVEQESNNNLESILRLKTGQIESWLRERQGDGNSLEESVYLAQGIQQFIKHPNDSFINRALLKRFGSLKRSYDYESVLLVNTQGKLLFGLGNQLDVSSVVQTLFPQVITNKETEHTDLYREENGHIHMDWVVPILGGPVAEGPVIAFIVLRIDPNRFFYPMIQSWPVPSKSAESLLVRQDGDSVLYMNELRFNKNSALNLRQSLSQSTLPAVIAMAADKLGFVQGVDYRGVKVLCGYSPIEGTQWRLEVKIDREEILAPMWSLLGWIMGILCVAIVGMMVVLFYLFRQQKITQRFTLKAEKSKSDQLLQQFYELPFIGMAIIIPETNQFLRVNDRFCQLLGYTREELINMTWQGLLHPDDLLSNKQYHQLLQGEINHYAFQNRFIRKNGQVIFAMVETRCVRQPDSKAEYIISTLEDITKKILTESHMVKLKEFYKNLATINEQILYATDAQQLLDNLCRIPIESGLMTMAWIGVEDPDSQCIVPLIKYGQGLDYLDQVTISTRADRVDGMGVAGTAYREQKASINNDTSNNPAMALWRDHALEHNWHAIASFPIFQHGNIYAVFTVYNPEVNFFDDEVITLINTLVSDVSFKLDAIDATQELIRSEARNRLLLESSPSGVIGIDMDGSTTFVNPSAAKMLGYSPEELTGIPMHETIHHSHADRSTYPWQACPTHSTLMDGKVRTFDNEVYWRKDNSCFPVGYTTHPIYQEGIIQGAVVVFQDITERLYIKKQLAEERKHLQNIIEGTNAGTWEWNLQTGETKFNERWAEIFGYQLDELVPFTMESWEQFVHPDDLKHSNELMKKHLSGELDYYECDLRMLHKDGHWVWISDRGKVTQRDEDGAPLIMSGTHIDASARCEAEETLRKAHKEELAIFDAATSGIILISNEFIIQRCNQKLETIFGYAAGELIGQHTRIWHLDQTTCDKKGVDIYKQIKGNLVERMELELVRKDGSLFWARLSGKVLDNNDPTKGFVIIIDDITQEHEVFEQLVKARDIAEEATRLKSDFLANMSHEIRTPMNGVLGMLELLGGTTLSPNQLDYLKTAQSSGEALLDIINDILDLTKLEADKVEIEQVEFNLIDLVEDVCALLSHRAYPKGLELNCSLPATLPALWHGDPMRIRQVLTNLLGNAVKFTQLGEVSVTVLPIVDDTNQTRIRFEIVDTGIGISEDTLASLFKPFIQADSATTRHFGGSGLGLSISKKLVELMGGNIDVTSTLHCGSCFWFSLPLVQSERNQTQRRAYDISGKRALIVDDNATNRQILNNYLNSWGLSVSEVDDGSTALMNLQTFALEGVCYDLILLDNQMPIMDGLTLAKCLTQIPILADIPIILLTSDNQIEPKDYQGTHIVQRLMKPLRQMQLYDAMVNALTGNLSLAIVEPKPKAQLPSFEGKTVLVVEDNKINQKVIVAKLAKFNIIPDVAENGQVALDKLMNKTYDLIFMDCHMPIMDGYAATEALRQWEAAHGLPHQVVIALTANALNGEREKCLAIGMDDYVTKPIDSELLMQLLIERLGVQSLRQL